MKRLLGGLAILVTFLLIGVALIIYAQGKRLDSSGNLIDTGILQVDSTPNEADIFIDGKFKAKSDNNIENLKPGTYTLKIQKDHYHTWEKVIEIKKGQVSPIKVTLFPSNPSLTALTFDGIYAPKISPDNSKIVFGIQNSSKAGLWIVNLENGNFFFGNGNSPKKILSDTEKYLFSKSTFSWTADNRNVLIEVQTNGSTETKAFLADTSEEESLNEVTNNLSNLKTSITEDFAKQTQDKLKKFPAEVHEIAKTAKEATFSKDSNAVLLINADNSAVVYDSKPSPVPNSKPQTYSLPISGKYFWYQGDSKHLISIEDNTINMLDSDGTNKFSIFSGDFAPDSVFSWPDGSRLIISINLNSKANPLPNLYTIGLRE